MKLIVTIALATLLACHSDRPSTIEDPLLPGAGSPSPRFEAELRAAIAAKGAAYEPRTEHHNGDGSAQFVNRLIRESSPYLLQHAHNPVNWYPWGDEAFERARREHRILLVSIGYSTCHWCHVMERESFEDEEVARYLNEHFVAIKVDREERPDVDAVYMSAVQAMTGRGGWPMTVLMTADRKPFFGGSYYPRDQFLAVLREAVGVQTSDPAQLAAQATTVVQQLAQLAARPPPGEIPGADVIVDAVQRQVATFDRDHGGFGSGSKFPRPSALELLLRYYRRTQDPGALRVVTTTLEHMAAGGIHDQIGGGFHRYATDAAWLVPHFEQMLYDNAQLAALYLDAYQATGRDDFRDVAGGVIDYVLRDMTSPDGAFYSATDADSRLVRGGAEEEGRFFTWTPAEISAAAGAHAPGLIAYYGVTASGQIAGRSILHVTGAPPADLAEGRRILLAARGLRLRPNRDDKIVTSWNGLMISALSRAALVLDRTDYADAAGRAADRVLALLRRADGRLSRSYAGGVATQVATLDDYAFLIQGLLDLFDATAQPRWLDDALALQHHLDAHYADPAGGYFTTANDAEAQLVRDKPTYDGAEPSGNAVALLNLLRLDTLTGSAQWRTRAKAGLSAFARDLRNAGTSSPKLLVALDWYLDSPLEVILIAPHHRTELAALLAVVRRTYVPNKVVIAASDREVAAIARLVGPADGKRALRGAATAFVCERGTCQIPTSDPDLLASQLARGRPLLDDRSPPALAVP